MSSVPAGSCLCGAVRFEIEGDFERFYLCHCVHCQKDTGSAHAANLFSSSAKLRWLAGEGQVSRFDLPGTRHTKSFCAACGSALPSVQMGGALVVVPAGSLDTPVKLVPHAHLFVSSRASWDHQLEDVKQEARLPTS
jgi:hypothetical protein